MADTLVLNKSFCAIQIIDWKKSMSLLYQDLAEVVDENYTQYGFDDWCQLSELMRENPSGFVHTSRLKIAIPDIIRLKKYDRLPSRDVKFTRKNIYQHYKRRCCYCGDTFSSKELNLDHVIPKSRGGKTDWLNVVTSCIECNTKKMNRTPEEAGMKLLVKPIKPKWKGSKSFIEFSPYMNIKTSWKKVIDVVYWNSELES